MGILHDELVKLKTAIGRAFDFADPAAYVAEAEAAFKQTVADAFHGLEDRVQTLEDELAAAFALKSEAPEAPAPAAPEVAPADPVAGESSPAADPAAQG